MKRHGRDHAQLSDWLSGRHNLFRKNREKIEQYLKNQETFILPGEKVRLSSPEK